MVSHTPEATQSPPPVSIPLLWETQAGGPQPHDLNLRISIQAQIENKFATSTWITNQIPATILIGKPAAEKVSEPWHSLL